MTEIAPASAHLLGLVGTKPAFAAMVTKTEPGVPEATTERHADYVYIRACREREWRLWKIGSPTWFSTRLSNGVCYRLQRQYFMSFWCSHGHPRCSIGVNISTPFPLRVSRLCRIRWTTNCIRRPGRSISRRRLTEPCTFAVAGINGPWSLDQVFQRWRTKGWRVGRDS